MAACGASEDGIGATRHEIVLLATAARGNAVTVRRRAICASRGSSPAGAGSQGADATMLDLQPRGNKGGAVRAAIRLVVMMGAIVVALALAQVATARVVVGASIDGVTQGATEAQVEALLGKPKPCTEYCASSNPNEWSYGGGFDGIITFSGALVHSMWTGAGAQRTSKGIHPMITTANGLLAPHGRGSSLREVKRAYPKAKCVQLSHSGGFATCQLTSRYMGRKVETAFLIKAASAGLAEIQIGFL